MKRLSVIIFVMLNTAIEGYGQHPDWGTLLRLDNATAVVVGKMHIDDLQKGLGTLEISRHLKGDIKTEKVPVIFSDRSERKEHTKQLEAPRYWYTEGQEGIWLLMRQDNVSAAFRCYEMFHAKFLAWILYFQGLVF